MGLINLTLPSDGETIDAADVNTPFGTIATAINGNLDNSNIKSGAAIDGSKIASASLTSTQMADSVSPVKRWDEGLFDFVASGCVWTGDAYGSTRVASMTSGVVYINGKRVAISAVTSRTFTASRDTYVDVDENGTISYSEVTNNAASPSLAANYMRIAIIVTGASNIANVGSINQGQQDKVLPIASSVAYSVTDSLGNLICNRNANPTIIGYKQITTSDTTGGTAEADIAALACPVIVPTGRKIKISVYARPYNTSSVAGVYVNIKESTTVLQISRMYAAVTNAPVSISPSVIVSPTAGLHTYKVSYSASVGAKAIEASSDSPTFIMVELV